MPGYVAPRYTIVPAQRFTDVLLSTDAEAAGRASCSHRVPRAVHRDYADLRSRSEVEISDAVLLVGMTAWTSLVGAISFDVFNHLDNLIVDRDAYFDAVVEIIGSGVLTN